VKCLLKQNLIAELKLPSHVLLAPSNQETKMKFALIGATVVAAAAFATPVLAQAVISDPDIVPSSTRTQIVKTWDRAIRTPMAVIIATTTGRTGML